ncbi:MAG: SGNH/GDSL hydrolase family protein [Wenzhouxiangella sp.]|jgi:lysophospholipase L1-like esterase|nr:SGNH/GDSL hydrolase family protein [Wenzhouxiangella sp.]
MRQLLFWTGFALVLPQALWVRRRAVRFEDAAGEKNGSIAGTGARRLIAIGDSIIAGVGCRTLDRACVGQTAASLARRLECGIEWQAIGRTGATTRRILGSLVPRLPDARADFIIVSAGVNDITGLKTLSQWEEDLKALLLALRQHSPGARIALLGIPPLHRFPRLPQPLRRIFGLRARGFDQVARALLAPGDIATYVPFDDSIQADAFAPDGYHPSEDSCTVLAEEVGNALLSIAERTPRAAGIDPPGLP